MERLLEKNNVKFYNLLGEEEDEKNREDDENIDSYGNEEQEYEDDDETLVFKAPSFEIINTKSRKIILN